MQLNMFQNLKVSHPRCVVKIQVREENPILYSHKTQLKCLVVFCDCTK